MCFSATASFTAAAALTAAGAFTLARARARRAGLGMTAFAAFPLLFGLQQGVEGLVWLGLDGRLPPALAPWTAAGFLFFALFLWPAAGPTVGWLIEARPRRRRLYAVLALAGLALGAFLFGKALLNPGAAITLERSGGHLVYLFGVRFPAGVELIYFLIASTALVGSSNPDARLFGRLLALSFAATFAIWETEVLPSVWCFFAALCSLAVLRTALRPAPAPAPAA